MNGHYGGRRIILCNIGADAFLGEMLFDRRYGLNQPLTDSRNMRKPTRITVLR